MEIKCDSFGVWAHNTNTTGFVYLIQNKIKNRQGLQFVP